MASTDFRIDPEPEPRRTRGKGAAKKLSDQKEISEAALVGLLSTGFVAVFSAAAIARGPHWNLQQREAGHLGKLFKEWLDTLPGGVYEQIEKYLGLILPSVSLIIGLGAAIGPRLELDRELRERANANTAKTVNPGAHTTPPGGDGRADGQRNGHTNESVNVDEFLGAGYR